MKGCKQEPAKIKHNTLSESTNKQLLKTRLMFNARVLSSHSVDMRWDLAIGIKYIAHTQGLAVKINVPSPSPGDSDRKPITLLFKNVP